MATCVLELQLLTAIHDTSMDLDLWPGECNSPAVFLDLFGSSRNRWWHVCCFSALGSAEWGNLLFFVKFISDLLVTLQEGTWQRRGQFQRTPQQSSACKISGGITSNSSDFFSLSHFFFLTVIADEVKIHWLVAPTGSRLTPWSLVGEPATVPEARALAQYILHISTCMDVMAGLTGPVKAVR